jgi:hypothetical protein
MKGSKIKISSSQPGTDLRKIKSPLDNMKVDKWDL